MGIVFSQPWGLLALLGIPILLLIHLLQRSPRRVRTSTLFLWQHLSPVQAQGRRLERLRNSLPLWLQILAVLLLTWLLVGPTWLKKDSQQTVVVVLDSSVSMRAFRDEMLEKLRSRLLEIEGAAARTRWILLASDPARPTLYSGAEIEEFLARLETWSPTLGTHDVLPALRMARTLPQGHGLVIFVSDHKTALPEGVTSLQVGHPIANCGFIGSRVGEGTWSALVRNYGNEVQTRTWKIVSASSQTQPKEMTLQPGETLMLKGHFPEGEDRCTLVLSEDGFSLDDRLPMVRERPKTLALINAAKGTARTFFDRFAASIADAVPGTPSPDLEFGSYDPFAPAALPARAIIAVNEPETKEPYRGGQLVKERHPLTRDLNFQGLITRKGLGIPLRAEDEVLLWQGEDVLVFLRPMEGGRSLVLNFDIGESNAARIPSMIVLMNRFAESVRDQKIAFAQDNFESNQRLQVAHDPKGPALAGPGHGPLKRAPVEPTFFEVTQGDKTLLSGASQFADVREADFRAAEAGDSSAVRAEEVAEKNRREDFLAPLWLLLLGVVCLGNWAVLGRRGGG